MARDKIVPLVITKGNTTAQRIMASYKAVSTANGAYIPSTGTKVDLTKLILAVERSSASTADGTITLVAGSTAGVDAFSGNSTELNLAVTVSSSTGIVENTHIVGEIETARFMDTDGYIKLNYSTAMAGARVAALIIS